MTKDRYNVPLRYISDMGYGNPSMSSRYAFVALTHY